MPKMAIHSSEMVKALRKVKYEVLDDDCEEKDEDPRGDLDETMEHDVPQLSPQREVKNTLIIIITYCHV